MFEVLLEVVTVDKVNKDDNHTDGVFEQSLLQNP